MLLVPQAVQGSSSSTTCFREEFSAQRIPTISRQQQQQPRIVPVTAHHTITDHGNSFQISIDVPDVSPKDLDVSVDYDTQMVQLTGRRSKKSSSLHHHNSVGDGGASIEYQKRLKLDDRCFYLEGLVMEFSNGTVVLTIPKKEEENTTASTNNKNKNNNNVAELSSHVLRQDDIGEDVIISMMTPYLRGRSPDDTIMGDITKGIEKPKGQGMENTKKGMLENSASSAILEMDEIDYWYHKM